MRNLLLLIALIVGCMHAQPPQSDPTAAFTQYGSWIDGPDNGFLRPPMPVLPRNPPPILGDVSYSYTQLDYGHYTPWLVSQFTCTYQPQPGYIVAALFYLFSGCPDGAYVEMSSFWGGQLDWIVWHTGQLYVPYDHNLITHYYEARAACYLPTLQVVDYDEDYGCDGTPVAGF